jgi:hypothetical protein
MNMNFTSTERGSGTHQTGGWVSPRPGFEMFTGKKNILLLLEIKPRFQSSCPEPSPYTDWAILIPAVIEIYTWMHCIVFP